MKKIDSLLRVLKDAMFGIFSVSDYSRLTSADIIMVCHDGDRSYTWRQSAYSPLLDSIAEKLGGCYGLRTISVAAPISRLRGPATWSNALAVNRLYVLSKITEKIFNGLIGINEVTFWEKIIKVVKPFCIIAIQPSPALCAAGKTYRVRVFDLQHGIVERSVYYNDQLTTRYGTNGYPDGVLVWDVPSEAAVKSCIPEVSVFRIGNEWLNRFLNPLSNDQLVTAARNAVRSVYVDNSKIILVTLQWNKSRLSEISIEDHVSEALLKLARSGWTIWIRFHPVQLQAVTIDTLIDRWQIRTNLIVDGSKVVDVSGFALPALLEHTTAHLTAHSASSIEASFFGVPTLLWRNDSDVRDWFKDYIKYGNIELSSGSTDEIVSWGESVLIGKSKRSEVTRLVAKPSSDLSALLKVIRV